MGSKSKRRHAQKQYNRAQNKPVVPETPVVDDAALVPDESLGTAPIMTAKEVRQMEKERAKQAKAEAKAKAKAQEDKKKDKGEKKPFFLVRFFKWLGRSFAEIGSELKKVHWPTFKQVMKATGIVLGVVVIFGIILFGIWELFGFLYRLLISM